jgi:hypothetical protein
MLNKFCVLFVGLAACLWGAVSAARADTVDAFGLTHTSLGSATLTTSSDGLVVGNLGSGGQDGVSIDISGAQGTGPNFALDTALNFGGTVPPVGAFFQQTTMAATSSGTNQVVSTITVTELTGSVSMTADFTPVTNSPLTVNYYSGGPNGTLEYSEQSPIAGLATLSIGWSSGASFPFPYPHSAYVDRGSPWYDPRQWTAGTDDWHRDFDTSFTTAGGTVLPASDNIDFVDFLATPTASSALGPYTSVNLTTGGPAGSFINSFTITGETVTTPEPSALTLLGIAGSGLLGFAWRRRRRAKGR